MTEQDPALKSWRFLLRAISGKFFEIIVSDFYVLRKIKLIFEFHIEEDMTVFFLENDINLEFSKTRKNAVGDFARVV